METVGPTIVVLDGHALNPGDLSWEQLERLGRVTVHERTPAPAVAERIADADIVLTNKTPVSRETIAACPRLRYIGLLATGYDVVDIEAAAQRTIVVANVPSYGTYSVAQHTIALLLELCHRVQRHDDAVKAGEWSASPDFAFWKHPLTELNGKTLGLIGMGNIGSRVARIADALGMAIMYNARREGRHPDHYLYVGLDELLRQADVVSLHCPATPETVGLIDKRALSLMKPSALLINTSRGKLVAERDLCDALNGGTIAGAALDVLPVEPPPADQPLLRAANCIVTPHIAWATREARQRLLDTAVRNVRAFLDGKPNHVVNPFSR